MVLDNMFYNQKIEHLDHFINLFNDLVEIEDAATAETVKKWICEEFKSIYNQNQKLTGITAGNLMRLIQLNNRFDIIPIEILLRNVDI